jgi:hypothetical protein
MMKITSMVVLLACARLAEASPPAAAPACPPEPDARTALTWWTPQRGVWTPIGWKDHLFRFTSVYNGAILVTPTGPMSKPPVEK